MANGSSIVSDEVGIQKQGNTYTHVLTSYEKVIF